MRLHKMIVNNRAPFERLTIEFDDRNITLFSGINGTGKTTLISYIVDALYELARKAYHNEFEDRPNKYYRVISRLNALDNAKPSIVFLRFQHNGAFIDYIDSMGAYNEEQYNEMTSSESSISFEKIKERVEKSESFKEWSIDDSKAIENIFNKEILTYFPAYRYETPSYINDPYKMKLDFDLKGRFSGYLINRIEIDMDLPYLANWIMDVALDYNLYPDSTRATFQKLCTILSLILSRKTRRVLRFGIGMRNTGMSRISIVDAEKNEQVYPSVFFMSSGELALLCLFGELLKQTDSINVKADDICGIVIVDEIEKHLHISLQREVLPKLIMMFPKLQFIVTSHSPFLGLGLEEEEGLSYKMIDLDNGGINCPPRNSDIYNEVYQLMIEENQQFAEQYNTLIAEIEKNSKPLIITEGKTDWKHLKAAMKALCINDLNVDYHEYTDTIGDTTLYNMLINLRRFSHTRKIIGVFDRDNQEILNQIKADSQEYYDFGNNVYAFAIPLVHQDIYGDAISIEQYYNKDNLCKVDQNGRRLFLGSEFHESGNSKDGKYQTRCKGIQNKVKVNGVIDERVFDRDNDLELKTSIALSKDAFAQYVFNEDEFAKEFDFSAFSNIFDVMRQIISIQKGKQP